MTAISKTLASNYRKFDPVRAFTWLTRIMVVLMVGMVFLDTTSPVYAATAEAIDPSGLIGVFKVLGEMFINIAYSLMVIVFAVGTVKSGLAAQTAQQFGVAGKASAEVMNLLSGVLVFVLGLMSLPLVRWVLNELGGLITPDLSLQNLPSFTGPVEIGGGTAVPTIIPTP
ncbi:MAG: hypothetical protein ACYDH2_03465 [Anaerolineaceae bacterium]